MGQLRTELAALETREKEHDDVIKLLPDLVRPMFSGQGRRRAVWPLAMRLTNELFLPAQAAIFMVRQSTIADALDEDFLPRRERLRLVLASSAGLPAELTQDRKSVV